MTMPSEPIRSAGQTLLKVIFSGRMLVALMMGFSSGLPLTLTGGLLQAWMKKEGVDHGTISWLTSVVVLPYTLKFLWAPLLDRFTPLTNLGRRRGWLLLIQVLLMLAIVRLGFAQPGHSLSNVFLAALLVAFFSASQDIVIDAYRRESLADDEQGMGASLYVNGYRAAMLLASGGGLILAGYMPFSAVYLLMAVILSVGVLTTLFCQEPTVSVWTPKTLYEAVVKPFEDYFTHQDAWQILLFIVLYKLGDVLASKMAILFYLDIGFTTAEIGTVVKIFGTAAMMVGGLLGGVLMFRLGLYRSLWTFGILQAVSVSSLAVLAHLGYTLIGLATVVAFENLSFGMGTAAYLAFMANLTNKKFTATQYALMSSLMSFSGSVLTAPTGYVADLVGWEAYFILCTLCALPGLWLLTRFRGWLAPEVETPGQLDEAVD